MPARDAIASIAACLDALLASVDECCEIIVVDDGSVDATAMISAAKGVRVECNPTSGGPAAARNRGVACARGEILVFVDSDVVVHPGALDRLRQHLAKTPDLAAVFGSYDAAPPAPGLVSQYRNLLHHFTHQSAARDAATFWAGCGAMRLAAFEAVGGYDPAVQLRFIEDVELGLRLRRAGCRIALDPAIQCTHLKSWTLAGMLRTDVYYRALPWARLILHGQGAVNDLNLKTTQRIATAATAAGGAALVGAPLLPALLPVAILAFAVALWMNSSFLGFLARARGPLFAVAVAPLHLLHHASGAFGFLLALAERHLSRRSERQHGAVRPAPGGAGRDLPRRDGPA